VSVLVLRLAAGRYIKWSNTTDSPVGPVTGRDHLKDGLVRSDRLAPSVAEELLVRVDAHGTGDPGMSLSEVIASDRAEPNEEARLRRSSTSTVAECQARRPRRCCSTSSRSVMPGLPLQESLGLVAARELERHEAGTSPDERLSRSSEHHSGWVSSLHGRDRCRSVQSVAEGGPVAMGWDVRERAVLRVADFDHLPATVL
jgi:hypothetical protein